MVRRPYKISACEVPRWLGHVLPLVARAIVPRVPCIILARSVLIQGLTCFWDERPCWRVPPSSAGFCLFLGSRDRGQNSFHAPDLSIRGPLSLVDEGFQHFHETCSHIHPPERPGSEASYLAKYLHPAFARRLLLQIRPMYPLWRQGTKVLRGPGLVSRCNFEGLRRRPCGAVDIDSLGIPRVLGMTQDPPSPERSPITRIIDL
ncbi:hypothetical protein DY000_02040732 [Brassica cretica]|uniref:Uncharacterized protein n=1 Tax=Brassica cretica TaxID=69181 RepID=A0ABQ7B6S5_BRACR|nr:hypothetical protein DY000_02040732 [Brassica cretica]